MTRRTENRSASAPAGGYPQAGLLARRGPVALRTYQIGALPIINHLLKRMDLRGLLTQHLPKDDPRIKIPTVDSLLVLLRNILLSREPIYGVGEWAARQAPDLLGLTDEQIPHLNDDRLARAMTRLFKAAQPSLFVDATRRVVREFGVSLQELHNDSTTVSFYGDYVDAEQPSFRFGNKTIAITFGNSKIKRPDLKQLLYILTVSDDGGVPVYMQTESGNTTDDRTHIPTWNLLYELVGSPDFLYVADCKLASMENLKHIASCGGRFVTVLPRRRKQDKQFRQRLSESPESVSWEACLEKKDDQDRLVDRVRVCGEQTLCEEGWRLWWYHSTAKQRRDAARRTRAVEKANQQLRELNERLASPRTRFRTYEKVRLAVQEILDRCEVGDWLKVNIHEDFKEILRQATRGRPGRDTKYVHDRYEFRYRVTWSIDAEALSGAEAEDGVFPLVSNAPLTAEQALAAYRRQPIIEKRFSNLKTDFSVSPVWLEAVSRIQGLLAVYFFVLVVQTLLERELRQAMAKRGVKSLPIYPEGRWCERPTARRVFDLFEPIQRHVLRQSCESDQVLITALTPAQRQILELLDIPANS